MPQARRRMRGRRGRACVGSFSSRRVRLSAFRAAGGPVQTRAMASELKAVILDVDGTLVDSNDAHAMAWVEAFAHFGFEVPFERVRDLIGKGGDKLVPECTG